MYLVFFFSPVSLQRPPNVTEKVPANWIVWDLAQPFELVELDPKKDEYRKPRALFLETLSGHAYDIDNIYRVQNHALWSAFKQWVYPWQVASIRHLQKNLLTQKVSYAWNIFSRCCGRKTLRFSFLLKREPFMCNCLVWLTMEQYFLKHTGCHFTISTE